jgi:mRNA-degrading endonuclease RelE of RelBE toxin-antitoxin system
MSFKIEAIPPFGRQLKRLSKKYPSIGQDLAELGNNLIENPMRGIPLGKDCYKIKLSIGSKGKGKSAGARIVTCVKIVKETVFLLTIFDKSDMENISDKELKSLLKYLDEEEM